MKPLAFSPDIQLSRPSSLDKTADFERVKHALASCGYGNVKIPFGLLKRLPSALRERDFRLKPVLGFTGDGFRVIGIDAEKLFGIAIDIGTTNIAFSLLDLVAGEKIDSAEAENPQMRYGDDLLTRIQRSMMGDDLHTPLKEGLNRTIGVLCERNGFLKGDIVSVVVAGNTAMTHFLLDLPVDHVPLDPYIPAAHVPGFLTGGEVGLDVNKEALVYVFPNAGSYVGGDIISGILATGIHREEEPSLFVDVGTNAEVVFGCREWLIVAAGAAGPALEGGISDIGMRATPGAISRVRIDRRTRAIVHETIGSGEAMGICGSGMIELVSELFDAGVIDQRGKFVDSSERFVFLRTADRELGISEDEIENFLRSKAGLLTSLSVLVKSVGLGFRDIGKFLVAGALGCGISVEKAQNIGMLPALEPERFIPSGNTSLKGAEMLLLDRDLYRDIVSIGGMITYRELNEDGDFMREFPGNLFIRKVEVRAREESR